MHLILLEIIYKIQDCPDYMKPKCDDLPIFKCDHLYLDNELSIEVLGSFLKGLKWLRTDLNRPRTGKKMNN